MRKWIYVRSGESLWQNKEGNKNKGHEQDGKNKPKNAGRNFTDGRKINYWWFSSKKNLFEFTKKKKYVFFLMNESNVYDSKFIFKMEKTKNDLNFQKFADGKTKRRREDQQKFLLPPLFLSLLLSTVAVSQLFFFFIIMCYIYFFFLFIHVTYHSFILLNINVA